MYKTLMQYERGEREPNILTIKRLADLLGVSVDALFEGVADEPSVARQSAKVPWERIGFSVLDVDDRYVRIEPSAELVEEQECAPMELSKVTFGKLTKAMLDESKKRYPDDQALAHQQFLIWAVTMTSKEAALRRLDPFTVIGSFVPIEYLPRAFRQPAERRSSTENQKASVG